MENPVRIDVTTPLLSTVHTTYHLHSPTHNKGLDGGLVFPLPQHVVIHINTYLDAKSIGKLAQSCKYFQQVAQHAPHYVRVREEFIQHKRQYEREYKRWQCLRVGTNILSWTFFGRIYEWVSILCVLLFTILVPLKLDKDVNWSWGVVFIPLMVAFSQVLFAPLMYLTVKSIFNYDFRDEFAWRSSLLARFFIKALWEGKRTQYFMVFTPIITLLTFFLLLLLHLSAVVPDNWWFIFSPLFLFTCYLPFVPFSLDWSNHTNWKGRVMVKVGVFFFPLLVILLAVKLSHNSISWITVFIPAFSFNAYFLLISIIFYILCKHFARLRVVSFTTSVWVLRCIIFYCPFFLLLITLEIFLLVHLEYHFLSFKLIFIPIFVLEGIGLLVTLFVTAIHNIDAQEYGR